MYPYNNQFNIDRINSQIRELEALKNNYQNQPQQPIQNIINAGSGQNIEFEARITNENENPSEILVQRKTAFIDLKKGLLSIKELNGDIKEFPIILPKTLEQLENEELKLKLKEMEMKINELQYASTSYEDGKSIPIVNANGKSSAKKSSE